MYVLSYALEGVIMEDIRFDDSESNVFNCGERVLIYHVPNTNIVAVQGIEFKRDTIDGQEIAFLSMLSRTIPNDVEQLDENSTFLEEFGIGIYQSLKREEIIKFVDSDIVMGEIRSHYNTITNHYRFGLWQ